MHGVSRGSLADRRNDLAGRDLSGEVLLSLADELYAVTGVLATNYGLRRSLSDPSVEGAAKVRVVDALLSGKVSDTTLEVLRGIVEVRWSEPRDLVDAVETLGGDAALIAADDAGQLDEVEDELFRFSRILAAEPALRAALSDVALPGAQKRELLERLLSGKATEVSRKLLEQVSAMPRGRTIERAISELSALAASRRDRKVARVTSAVELTADEQRDLAAALAEAFGSELFLQLVVDPELIGGLTVRVGDEVIDATVSRQLDDARRRLTGGSTRTP